VCSLGRCQRTARDSLALIQRTDSTLDGIANH
jgi:hypothetical protein